MFYEYALISVVIASGWWGYYFLRHRPHGTPLFGMMQLGAAMFAGLGLVDRGYDVPAFGVLGAIGLGGGICLLIVGPLVRGIARRFAAAERIGIASRLLDVAEILAPGSGVAEEKALLGAMKEIREGRVEQTVDALTAAKDRAPEDARLAIDERIAMLYLAAYRWRDAITYAETHLMPSIPPPPGELTPQMSLRDALGIAPPVWIELLGAYGRTGDLDRAATMMARLEDVCAGRAETSPWLHRGRMMFLALAGRPDAVKQLVEPKRARHMSAAARTYWVAVALQHHGDREAASAAFQRARSRSRGRPRDLIDEALARLDASTAVTLSPETTKIVAAIESAPLPPPIKVAQVGGPYVTWGITLVLLAVAAVIHYAIGETSDPGVLLRAGALVRGPVEDGEWWRVVSCTFVHVGPVHLIVNVIGIYFLARVLEEIFGSARTLAIYGAAGIAGALASHFALGAISAGASGAIFGVLGAVFVELTLHKTKYRQAWKRGMWGGLVVVTLAQAGIGFLYPVIDQWAHGAGLLAGVLLGAALSPSVAWARINLWIARVLAAGFIAISLVAAVLVVRTSTHDSLTREPMQTYAFDRQTTITAPGGWIVGRELRDPDNLIQVYVEHRPTTNLASDLEAWFVHGEGEAKSHGIEEISGAPEVALALPTGWTGVERIGTIEDPMGQLQRWRIVLCGRELGGEAYFVLVLAPDSVAVADPSLFTGIIGSISPRDTTR